MHPNSGLFLSLSLLLSGAAVADSLNVESTSGVLDISLPESVTILDQRTPKPAVILVTRQPEKANEVLRSEFADEQKALEQMPQSELQTRAERGERAAQVVLAETFAKEAALLSYAPDAAAQAMGDAARWMSAAAEKGFPGAPTLDQAGVKVFPFRAPRSR